MAALVFDGSQPGTPMGYYTYTVAEDHWSWSDGVYGIHGFAPNEVPATTAVLLSHKHPDDRVRAFEVLETAVRDGEQFSCYHRIIDRRERVRSVLAVGRGIKRPDGTVERLVGFFVDLTEVRRSETSADVEVALARIAESRAVIEQAKGMMMLATGCGADAAFELLRVASQNTNVKVRDVARLLVDGAGARISASEQTRATLETFLMGLKQTEPDPVSAAGQVAGAAARAR